MMILSDFPFETTYLPMFGHFEGHIEVSTLPGIFQHGRFAVGKWTIPNELGNAKISGKPGCLPFLANRQITVSLCLY